MVALALIGAVALAGCAPMGEPAPSPLGGECRESGLKDLLGKTANSAVVAAAKRRAGAGVVRVIAPNMRVTMDYRTGRLNVWTDMENRVERFSCG